MLILAGFDETGKAGHAFDNDPVYDAGPRQDFKLN